MNKKDEKAREKLVDALKEEGTNSKSREKSRKKLKFKREENE